MGRRNTRWTSNVYQVFVIGEQLRKHMHEQGQVKDRRHHLRKHKQCFIGRDIVDWLLKVHHVQSREEAVNAMQILKQHDLFHHITNEHEFKDQNHFYRFSYDDNTYKFNLDLASFYWGLDIYRKLKASNGDVMQEFYLKGSLYSDAFFGCDLVDFIMVTESEENRDAVVVRLRDLLEKDIIKHVTDDYHFCDDKLIYEFNLDFDKPCSLRDIVDMMAERSTTDMTSSQESMDGKTIQSGMEAVNSAVPIDAWKGQILSAVPTGLDPAEITSRPRNNTVGLASIPRTSDSLRHEQDQIENTQKLNDPNFTNFLRNMKIKSDHVGFGFSLRGSSPCYVYSVDPWGPAAAAGVKKSQFVTVLNGQDVTGMSHRQVGKLFFRLDEISMTVLTCRRSTDVQVPIS